MATPLTGTVIVTGVGVLGSEITLAIARRQPLVHLLVVARNLTSPKVKKVSEKVRMIGPRSFEIAEVDLADFSSVARFANHTVRRVKCKEIPPITVLINCAAISSYVVDSRTLDGFDLVYQVNCLSPFLLTVGLLEAFRAENPMANAGARVINIGCSAISRGKMDYFERHKAEDDPRGGTPLNAKEGLRRFGSSKLLMNASMYALRKNLVSVRAFSLTPLDMS
jgi:mannan polymerase II complex ANP1 subunit